MRSCALIAALLLARSVLGQSPVLHRIFPLGVPASGTTEVMLTGEKLSGITGIWRSAEQLRVESTNGSRLLVTLPGGWARPVALRVATTNGVSDLAMLMVDELKSEQESGTNRTLSAAQPVQRGCAIDGVTDELGFDYFYFEAKRRETIAVDVAASRLASKLDPVVRILDAQGRELAFCEDAPRAGRDCRVRFQAPASGRYFIEVRDIAYGGGPQFYYRLRAGDFAFEACAYPLSAASGNVPLSFEREPNDLAERSLPVTLPSVVNGRFETSEDRDWFAFKAEKDQRLTFITKSRSAGSPCDVFLELRDANGKVVVESNPAGAQDTALTNKFSDSGEYFLVARELAGRGAADFAYQIEIKDFEPGFTLAVDEDKFEAKSGGEVSITVSCVRYDFAEKISLQCAGLPVDFKIEGATIEEKKTNATLKIKVPDDAAPGKLFAFSVTGTANERQAKASTMSVLRRNMPLLLNPPPELDGVVVLGITGGDPAPKPKRKRT